MILLIGLVYLTCNQETKEIRPRETKEIRPKEANMSCGNFFIKGQYNIETYTFCSTIPTEVQYRYKSGYWKFWNIGGQLIAEGAYKLEKKTIEGQGGCSYEIIEGIIDEPTWKFWDNKGNQTGFNEELISQLKSCIESLN